MPSNVDGNGYYRNLYPGRQLARLGHTVGWVPHNVAPHGSRIEVRYEVVQAGRVFGVDQFLYQAPFDCLLMGQRSEPWTAQLIRNLRSQGKRVVVDCDDNWLQLPAYNPGSRKPKADVDAMLAQLEAADALTVSTPALAELYQPYNNTVTVIRNGLDWDLWQDVTVPHTKRLRVGWTGELWWRKGDLDVLRGVLGPWLSFHPDIEFVAAGDPQVHDYLAIPQDQRVSVGPTQFWWLDLPDITATFNIGLVPLAKNALNEGKSHLKGLEYNACGVPYIASPSESYRWFTDGNGLLASTPREWREALDALVADPQLRTQMGARGRQLAEETSVARRAHEWEAAVCVPHRNLAEAGTAA